MEHRKYLLGIAVVALALSLSGEAGAQMCTKINASLRMCEVLANTCQSSLGTPGCTPNGYETADGCVPTFGQERFYYQQLYVDPPGNGVAAQAAYDKACGNLMKWTKNYLGLWPNGYGGPVQAALLPDGTADCRINFFWPAKGNLSTVATIGPSTFPREPECNRTPHGPYENIAPDWRGTGTSGKPFNVLDRWDIARELNPGLAGNNGLRFSDAVRAGANESWPAFQALTTCPRTANDTDPIGYPDPIAPPGDLERLKCFEVDHLIPAKDIHGCDCGDDSAGNALLISRELNETMSNDMTDANRQILLQYYTSP